MGYKKMDKSISLAVVALLRSMEHNRSVKMMERINKVANSQTIEAPFREYYPVGLSHERADACPPLMVFHCLLLRRRFHIPSCFEFEKHINKGISSKKLLGLPFAKQFPDRSIFSRLNPSNQNQRCCCVHSLKARQIAARGLHPNKRAEIFTRFLCVIGP